MKKFSYLLLFLLLAFSAHDRAFAQQPDYISLIQYRDFLKELRRPHEHLLLVFQEITYFSGEEKHTTGYGLTLRNTLMKMAGTLADERILVQNPQETEKIPAKYARYTVSGNYWDWEKAKKGKIGVRLIFEPVAAKSGNRKIVYLRLDKSAQTQVVSNEAVRKTYQELAGYFEEGDLHLKLWTSVREGTELGVDEPFTIYLKANKNCYFVLFSRNSEGEIDPVFPLTAQDDNLLVANSPFDFADVSLSPPLGLEVLFAFAAEKKAELSTQKALEVFEIYYQTRIAQKVGRRSIRRKSIAADWTWLYSVPPR